MEKVISLSRLQIEQAEENLRINQEKFKNDEATSTEVLDAQAMLLNSQNNRINSICDYNIKYSELINFMGKVK